MAKNNNRPRPAHQENPINFFLRVLVVLFIGFAGGILAPLFAGWLDPLSTKLGGADAVAVANTYIVFTTIIFVGFTVVLGVASYVFTQQFSTTKETQVEHLIRELEERLRDEDGFGIEFIDKALENPDVQRHVSAKLEEKIYQLILEAKNNKQKAAQEAQADANDLDSLANRLKEKANESD